MVEFTSLATWSWTLLLGRAWVKASIPLLLVHLFKLSSSSRFSLGGLHVSKNVSISSRLLNMVASSLSEYSRMILTVTYHPSVFPFPRCVLNTSLGFSKSGSMRAFQCIGRCWYRGLFCPRTDPCPRLSGCSRVCCEPLVVLPFPVSSICRSNC